MRKTVVAVCLLLCLGIAHARLSAAPADEGNKKCNKPCADAYRKLTGKTPINTRSQVQDKKDDKGNDNKGNDNKGNDNQENEKKFCAGSSCSGCATASDYAAVCDAVRCTGRPTTQEALNAVTKRSDITWDSCRFVRVGSECKSKCEDSCKAAGCSATTYSVACVQNTATKKAEWAKVITPATQAVCTPMPTPPRTCSGAPPGSVTRSGVTTAYAWPAACKDLAVATPSWTCTAAASCPTSATATCTDQGPNQAPAWVVTDVCPAPIPTPQLCTAVPVLANTTFASGCAATIGSWCLATGCATGFLPINNVSAQAPISSVFATCTAAGWTFSGACVGPAKLVLELVGTSPVASGSIITFKVTLTQANTGVGGRGVILQAPAATNVAVTCPGQPSTTDVSGVARFTCTVGQLTAPIGASNQPAPLVATIVLIASVVDPTILNIVNSPPLTVPVAGALCGGFTGTGTTAYYEGFEGQLAGPSVTGISTVLTVGAFQGNNMASVTASTSGAGSLWGTPVPTNFPVAGKFVAQVAVYLDPNAAMYTTSGLQFVYSVGLNKPLTQGAARSRTYRFNFGWYDAANSGLTSPKKTFWVTASDSIQGDPKSFTSNRVSITEAGWYYLQIAFVRETCQSGLFYPFNSQCVVALMGVFRASLGGSCGSTVATLDSWKITPRFYDQANSVSDLVADLGGAPTPGLFQFYNTPSTTLSVDAFSYTSFSN